VTATLHVNSLASTRTLARTYSRCFFLLPVPLCPTQSSAVQPRYCHWVDFSTKLQTFAVEMTFVLLSVIIAGLLSSALVEGGSNVCINIARSHSANRPSSRQHVVLATSMISYAYLRMLNGMASYPPE
jgi:hypothetical protein